MQPAPAVLRRRTSIRLRMMTETFLDVGVPLCLCQWTPTTPIDALPVVILHGFLEQGAAWHAVAQKLADAGRTVVAPDHRGHGRSAHIAAGQHYHFWDYVGDVQAVVDSLGGRVDLVGHSMGGTMASLFAGSRPEAVRKLVLVEGLGPPDLEDAAVSLGRQFLDARRSLTAHPVMATTRDAAGRMQRFNPRLDDETSLRLAERTTHPVEGGVTWSWDTRHRARNPYPFQSRLFVRFLSAITADVLLVDGADSAYAKATDPARREALSQARLVIVPGAGHLLHHDQPRALANVIQDFLES
jgi:pimeloyl-ACP methyl ester carboxylesterase